MDINEGHKRPRYSSIPYCLGDGTSWVSPQKYITSEKELTVYPSWVQQTFNRENQVPKHKSRGPAPIPSALPGRFHTQGGDRKWEQRNKWLFFPAHHSLRAWLPPLNCPQCHCPLPSRFIFSQALSPIRLWWVPVAKASLFSFCRLCWRRHCLARIYTLLHGV